jgi:hypothetical protein
MSDIQDLLERFRRGPEVLAVVLTGVFGEEEDFVAAPGEWSIRQVIAHLADSELVAGHRFRLVIAEDSPTMLGYDQNAWARNLGYERRKPKSSLESFRRLRAENYEILKDLPADVYERKGNHSEHGVMTLRDLLASYADHAESHARQMQNIRERFKEAKGRK